MTLNLSEAKNHGCRPHRRGSVRRASGFVLTDKREVMSGRTMARIGLRMMPPFPSSPLRFRTVSFPQSGSKAGISDGAFPSSARNFATCGLHPPFVQLAALTSYPRSRSRDAVR